MEMIRHIAGMTIDIRCILDYNVGDIFQMLFAMIYYVENSVLWIYKNNKDIKIQSKLIISTLSIMIS